MGYGLWVGACVCVYVFFLFSYNGYNLMPAYVQLCFTLLLVVYCVWSFYYRKSNCDCLQQVSMQAADMNQMGHLLKIDRSIVINRLQEISAEKEVAEVYISKNLNFMLISTNCGWNKHLACVNDRIRYK